VLFAFPGNDILGEFSAGELASIPIPKIFDTYTTLVQKVCSLLLPNPLAQTMLTKF
jgi:phospholipase/lecithinase/hemolysin